MGLGGTTPRGNCPHGSARPGEMRPRLPSDTPPRPSSPERRPTHVSSPRSCDTFGRRASLPRVDAACPPWPRRSPQAWVAGRPRWPAAVVGPAPAPSPYREAVAERDRRTEASGAARPPRDRSPGCAEPWGRRLVERVAGGANNLVYRARASCSFRLVRLRLGSRGTLRTAWKASSRWRCGSTRPSPNVRDTSRKSVTGRAGVPGHLLAVSAGHEAAAPIGTPGAAPHARVVVP